jgi:hypothetical protein
MNKKQYFKLDKVCTEEEVLLKPVKKFGRLLTINNSKFTFFVNSDGEIINGETGLSLGYIEAIEKMGDLDDSIKEYINFFGLIKNYPAEGRKFHTIFTKYKDEFKRIFKIDMTNFRDNFFHRLGYDSFDIINFDENFIRPKTEITGKSTKEVIIEKFGQEACDLMEEILNAERADRIWGLIKRTE